MTVGQEIISTVVIIVVLLFAMVFVAAEFALVKVRKSALEDYQTKRERPSRQANLAIHMVENLNEYLSTTQVGITLSGLILGWLGEATVASLLLDLGILQHIPGVAAGVVASVIALVLLTYIEVVFTELIPKNVAIEFPIRVLLFVATPLRAFHLIFYPFVWLLNVSAVFFTRIMGLKTANEDEEVYSEAEILSLTRIAARQGEVNAEDYVFMERAFEMTDKTAVDIMVDRTELEVVDVTTTVKVALQRYFTSKHSRFPVVANHDKDKILGYVFNYDIMYQATLDDSVSVRKVIRNIPTVPENMPIMDVLSRMIASRTPMVVVGDEYGGTSGIVTDKDIYEELFGTVRDEVDEVAEDMIEKVDTKPDGSQVYKVSGKLTLYDFERFFKIDIPVFDNSEMVTLSGFILDNEDLIQNGSQVVVAGFLIKVLDYKDTFINELEVTQLPVTAK